jgi:hypothetical protein
MMEGLTPPSLNIFKIYFKYICKCYNAFPLEGQTGGGTFAPQRWYLARETLLLPRKCLFAPERHLCPLEIKKKL